MPVDEIVGTVKPFANTSVGIHMAQIATSPDLRLGAVVPLVSSVVNAVPDVGAVVLEPSAVP